MEPSRSTDDPRATDENDYQRERRLLIEEIEAEMVATADWTGTAALDPHVKKAMEEVPRHEFVPEIERSFAYVNHPLPIGWDQTISQPYIVALMTNLLQPVPKDIVLEIGTGSGYQAAVLSLLVQKVYSIEVVPGLAERAARVLHRLGYDNVEVRAGDGAHGWPERAPFDKIIVTAEAAEIPRDLIDQLKPRGLLVMPVGSPYSQQLMLLKKHIDGAIEQKAVLPVAFVPLRSED